MSGSVKADQVTFDSPGDLAANFTINNQTGSGGYTEMPSGGISNTRAVDVTTGPSATLDATAIYNKLSFNPQNGTIAVSEFVKIQAITSTADRLLHLGIIDDTAATHQLNGGLPSKADFISARLNPTAVTAGTLTPFAFQAQAGQSDGTNGTTTTNNPGTPVASVNLTTGNWYQFTVLIGVGAANTFNVGGTIQDFGTDGATPGALTAFGPFSLTTNTSDMYNDPTVFGAFRSFQSTGGADALDNFMITQTVPEPGTLGACLLAALMSVGVRRRRAAKA